MSLPPEELKAMAQRFNDEVWNNRNLSIIEEFIAPEFTTPDWNIPLQGPDGYRQYIEAVLTAFPDAHVTIEDFLVEGDKTVSRWIARGTHQGTWGDIAATGKVITARGINISRVNSEGKLVEQWQYGNDMDILQQMGATPTTSQAPA